MTGTLRILTWGIAMALLGVVTINPMYLGMVMMLTGVATFVSTLPFYVAAVALFAILNFVFCPYEEGKLARTFSSRFLRYRDWVRRWL